MSLLLHCVGIGPTGSIGVQAKKRPAGLRGERQHILGYWKRFQ